MSALFDRRPTADASGSSAVAAGGSIGQAVTGPGAVGLHIENVAALLPDACPPAESVRAPDRLTNLPFRADLCLGRDAQLALLHDARGTSGRPLVHVVHGLGGIGKSTLVARMAAEHTGAGPVWWIKAGSRAAIDAGLAHLASVLQPSLGTVLPREQMSEWALRWLTAHTGWLVVLDDVAHPADAVPLLARVTSGRFLITSRLTAGWQGIAEEVPLGVLSPQDAVRLFTEIHGADPDAARLCAELGHLPLAVTQAAAYCRMTHCTASTYLEELAKSPADMYAETVEGGDHERTVARVWHVTLDRLADDPLAVRILLMLAWYASEGIPRDLFASLDRSLAVRRAFGRLAAHSMITLSGDTVSVHRLVQAVSRAHSPGDRHRGQEAVEAARGAAVDALAVALPEDMDEPSAWPVMRSLLPHAEALAEHVRCEDDTPAMVRLLARTGDYLLDSGGKAAARGMELLRRAEAGCLRLHGAEAEETLEVRVALARVTRMLRPLAESAPLAETVVADCTRILGADHLVTLDALSNLRRIVWLKGDADRAVRLAEECLAGLVRLRGPDHPDTLRARHDLVMTLDDTAGEAGTRDMRAELLRDCRRALGEEHPVTLSVRNLDTVLARRPVFHPDVNQTVAGLFSVAEEGDREDLLGLVRVLMDQVMALGPLDELLPRTTEEDVRKAERDLETSRRVLGDASTGVLEAQLALLLVYGTTRDERYEEAATALLQELFAQLSENPSVMTPLLRVLEAFGSVLGETARPEGS